MDNLNLEFIEQEARKYKSISTDTLLEKMLEEWYASGGNLGKTPTRGSGKDFLKSTVKRLAEKIVENRATVSAAFGLAVGETVAWARTQGLDLTAYRIFISVMAAAVANSVIDELEGRIIPE